jgi:hypothetical protein
MAQGSGFQRLTVIVKAARRFLQGIHIAPQVEFIARGPYREDKLDMLTTLLL